MSDASSSIEAVLERRRGELASRVATVEEAVTALVSGGLDEELRALAEREAHKLAGSLGMFGLPRGSEVAVELEQALGPPGGPNALEGPRMAELVLDLHRQLRQKPVDEPAPGGCNPAAAPTARAVLFTSPDPDLTDRLTVAALGRDLRPRTAVTCTGARRMIESELPDAAVLDINFAEAESESLDLLEDLTGREPPVPVLVLTASEALVDRVEVSRRGGNSFVQRTRPASEVIDAVREQIECAGPTQAKILAVDDDAAILEGVAALLGPAGFEVISVEDPHRFWEQLTMAAPDLLLLDLDMPQVSGLELCRSVRADPQFGQLPIVFLSAYSDASNVQAMFEAGADDYVSKPIIGTELSMRVGNRLDRVRVYRDLAEKDHLTGIASRRRSSTSLEDLVVRADRLAQPFSLSRIDLDRFACFNQNLGEATGDAALRGLGELLAETFHGEDVVGRWGDDEFVVGAYGMTADDGVQRVAEMLERFRHERYGNRAGRVEPLSFSAGVAEYPRDAHSLQELHLAAGLALDEAKARGGDRVLPASSAIQTAPSQADIVVVDDDDLLAGLLTDSLHTRGYRTLRFDDGREAVDALSGAAPRVSPGLILLDVDLPGLDGLSVLRQLAQEGVLERTRVIMLTAHAGEAEIVESLELGAIDHVSKPFSMPVLIQRVRRALRR